MTPNPMRLSTLIASGSTRSIPMKPGSIPAGMTGAVRFSTLYILAAALAGGLGLWAAQTHFSTPAAPAMPAMRSVTLFPQARVLAPYKLTSSDGITLTPAAMKGHWTLVYLGFTRCPDVCPTTLQTLGQAEKAWAVLPRSSRPRVLFVSVDPAHDTPQRVGEYAHYFGKDILGATADDATLTKFARSLAMVYMKVPTTGGDYTIDHSASVSVLDPDGNMAGLIRPPFDPVAIGADMRALSTAGIAGSSPSGPH
jgi:protein SCO1/2